MTVGEYLNRWLVRHREGHGTDLDIRAQRGDRTVASSRPWGVWGSRSSPRLTCADYGEKLDSGLAPATVRRIHSTLHKALSQAVSDGIVPRNAAHVKAPRPAPEEIRPLSEDEARAFLESARQSGERFEALYVLAITGLRRGELLGLRWDDADLELGTLRVGRALVREGGRHTLGETKTRRGRRQINLTPRTVNALKAHRKSN